MSHWVAPDYRHRAKRAMPADPLLPEESHLKFYLLAAESDPVPEPIEGDARAFLRGAVERGDVAIGQDAGFVLLHRCGADFYFLLLCVWRSSNELWEAVYYRDSGMSAFAPFVPANPGPSNPLRPTFCVWELGVVRHEAACWIEFLSSARDEDARRRWKRSHFAGAV